MQFSQDITEKAVRIHRDSIFISTQDPTMLSAFDREYIDKLLIGGVTCLNKMISSPWPGARERAFVEGIRSIQDWRKKFKEVGKDDVMLVRSVKDIHVAKEQNKVGFILGFQSAKVIEEDLENLAIFKELGVGIIQLTYQRRNLVADGGGEKTDCGLSEFGFKVVREMNRLGVLVDLSHVGYKSAMDAIECSELPSIFSHSNALALCTNPRNIPDDLIKALAKKNGVMGIAMYTPLLKVKARPTLQDFLDHICYVSDFVGVDHVGIGLDYNYKYSREVFDYWQQLYPEVGGWQTYGDWYNTVGMEDVTDWINITKGLVARGFSEEEIKKVLGGNFLRVFQEVWGNAELSL